MFFLPLDSFNLNENDLVLYNWNFSGFIGSMFVHANIIHLLGNMIFLWVFGNALCAAIGNIAYLFLYICLGIFAGTVHMAFDAHPVVGASGAINGVVGMCVILFPKNKLHCWYFFALPFLWFLKAGKFAISTYWMVLIWLVFDILGNLGSPDGIAHYAHIGGLVGGVIIAIIGLKFKLIETPHQSVFDIGLSKNLGVAQYQLNAEAPSSIYEPFRHTKIENQTVEDKSLYPADTNNSRTSITPKKETINNLFPADTLSMQPDIQLKHCISNETTLTLYLVNNGAPLKFPKLRVPKEVKAQMSFTNLIRYKETGWIRFSTDNITIDSIEFLIYYVDSAQQQRKIRFRCVPAKSSLELISAN